MARSYSAGTSAGLSARELTPNRVLTKFEENEDNNARSENAVLVAKAVGSKEDVAKAEAILARHNKDGEITPENGAERQALMDKLKGKWDAFTKDAKSSYKSPYSAGEGKKEKVRDLPVLTPKTIQYETRNKLVPFQKEKKDWINDGKGRAYGEPIVSSKKSEIDLLNSGIISRSEGGVQRPYFRVSAMNEGPDGKKQYATYDIPISLVQNEDVGHHLIKYPIDQEGMKNAIRHLNIGNAKFDSGDYNDLDDIVRQQTNLWISQQQDYIRSKKG